MSTELPHVFLGGECGKSTYRQRIAIPRLREAGITFFNPQVAEGEWHHGLIELEAVAKDNAVQILIVIGGATRAGASILEAEEYVCYGSFVHLVIDNMPDGTVIDGHVVTGRELEDVNRMREYLRSVVKRRRPHLPVHDNVDDAVTAVIKIAAAYGFGGGS
jgi:raw